MYQSTTNRELVLVTSGNLALVAAGTALTTISATHDCCGGLPTVTTFYNIRPGQLGVYDANTNLAVAADDITQLRGNIFFAVGVDNDGDGITDDIITIPGDILNTCSIKRATSEPYRAPSVEIVDFLFDCAECGGEYVLGIEVKDNRMRRFYQQQRDPQDVYAIKLDCCADCEGVTPEVTCASIVDAFQCEYRRKAKQPHSPLFQYPFYDISETPEEDLTVTINEGCDNEEEKTFTCGIRVTGLAVDRICNCFDPELFKTYMGGSKICIYPKSGFGCGNHFVNVVQTLEFGEGMGDVIMHRELINNQNARGRGKTRYHWDSPDKITPNRYTELNQTTNAVCAANYCQYVFEYDGVAYSTGLQSNHVAKFRAIVAVPTAEAVTQASFEAVINPYLIKRNCVIGPISCSEDKDQTIGENTIPEEEGEGG
ncbi:MAG TPA: hypothetical protein PKD00_06095 [Burkholderiales bacterium]|nr:hypothetical protein [Burkholderiales bacterium]